MHLPIRGFDLLQLVEILPEGFLSLFELFSDFVEARRLLCGCAGFRRIIGRLREALGTNHVEDKNCSDTNKHMRCNGTGGWQFHLCVLYPVF